MSERKRRGNRQLALLIGLMAVAAAFNLTKAVHIDDAGHLETARAILADPLHPMSGHVNWDQSSRPISELNQPHLFFYVLAGMVAVSGGSELVLHVFMAVIVSLTILVFYRLARVACEGHALLLTALLVLGPAFLPAQNLMLDIPLLALWLLFFLTLLTAEDGHSLRRYAACATVAAAACLVKYPSLVLLPLFALTCILRRRWRMLALLAIPALALAGWSAFNWYDYGGIHILGRKTGSLSVAGVAVNVVDYVAGLGMISLFSVAFLVRPPRRWTTPALLAIAGLTAAVAAVAVSGRESIGMPERVFWVVFLANGTLVLAATISAAWHSAATGWRARGSTGDTDLILLLWLLAAFGFFALFTPFMAIRHVLLGLPPLLLLLGRRRPRGLSLGWGLPVLLPTAVLGLWIALSDWQTAAVYREYAPRLAADLPAGARVCQVGHWGWQWYAAKAGMEQYDIERTELAGGDYLIVPTNVHRQRVATRHRSVLRTVRVTRVPSDPLTWLRPMARKPWGGYYAFSWRFGGPPVRFTREPLELFRILVVEKPAERSGAESGG